MRTLAAAALAALALSGCSNDGCIGDDSQTCQSTPPCPRVTFACPATTGVSVSRVTSRADRPGGTNALAAYGDFELRNDFVRAVISNLGNQNYLDPNGGALLDLATVDGDDDGLNEVLQVVGVLPADSAHYTSLSVIDESPARVAIQLRGTLDGHPDVPIFTRYELLPCDRGVRVRSEILNASPDNQFWTLADGFYWSKREPVPFTPAADAGFTHPSFDLTTINAAFQSYPFLAASFHNGETASYAEVSCTDDALHGFNSEVVSTAGVEPQVVPPRGILTFDRFIAVADTGDVAGAAGIAMQVREQVLGEAHVTISGTVENGAQGAPDIVISEGLTPWTQVKPGADGGFSAVVPAGRSYTLSASAFGQVQLEKTLGTVSQDTDVGTLTLPQTARVTFSVKDTAASPLEAEIFIVPADDATKAATTGTFHGQYATCAPWLGPPPGGSPACNRVLVHGGVATVEVPPGNFHFYAFHGPNWSLGHAMQVLDTNPTALNFTLTKLDLQPTGAVSADFHVHGAASFDSSIPDEDRVLSFAASDLDVIIATDHDVVHDYADLIQQLGLGLQAVAGVETTGHVPYLRIPNYGFPLVIGHYNFWPLRFDPTQPRNGGPFDELIEPGALFDRVLPLTTTMTPVFQLNHPWADSEFGRDLGFPRAVKMDLRQDLPAGDDGTSGLGVYVRTPHGGFANDAHHAQEVMNGSSNGQLLQYRAFWFYLLNQGRLRTGTANSDSHSLVDSTVGIPRNVVLGSAPFDVERMNQAVRAGRVLGTNGPIISATLDGHDFGLAPFQPAATGAMLHVKVTSAPWVPVAEVRVVVNGVVAKTIGALPLPTDAFASTAYTAFEGDVAVDDVLAGVRGDAWLVIEAGSPLLAAADLGGGLNGAKDGMPDTTDNNGDGVIDAHDVPKGSTIGPLRQPDFPAATDIGFAFANVTDDGYPFAFTNPFVLDRDGNGRFDAPGVKGGR